VVQLRVAQALRTDEPGCWHTEAVGSRTSVATINSEEQKKLMKRESVMMFKPIAAWQAIQFVTTKAGA